MITISSKANSHIDFETSYTGFTICQITHEGSDLNYFTGRNQIWTALALTQTQLV